MAFAFFECTVVTMTVMTQVIPPKKIIKCAYIYDKFLPKCTDVDVSGSDYF